VETGVAADEVPRDELVRHWGSMRNAIYRLLHDARRKLKSRPDHARRRQKLCDTRDFVEALRLLQVTPHVAQNTSHRSSAIDRRTTRHPGYEVSQWKRKRVEEIFGWLKTVGLLRKTRHRGRRRVSWLFIFTLAVYNLVRIRNLTAATG
jgi:hypothetical protein